MYEEERRRRIRFLAHVSFGEVDVRAGLSVMKAGQCQ